MGQLISDTSEDEQHEDLDSAFSGNFKNWKMENKLISRETISAIQSHLTKGNIQKTSSVISAALKEIGNIPINIAVTAESGAGKSSFINALRGIEHEEEDAAPISVLKTPTERAAYTHPNIPNVTIWDLPCIGTTNFQPKDYLKHVKFHEYDCFIIASATRFQKSAIDLAKVGRCMMKNVYFVRTKVDCDLKYAKKCKPSTFNREKILEEMWSYILNKLQKDNIHEPKIFLVSNNDSSQYDFPILKNILLNILPSERHNTMLLIFDIAKAAIDTKRDSLKQAMWLEALKAGSLATLPVAGIINDKDIEKLKTSLSHYQDIFGVNDASLQGFAKDLQVPVEQLKAIIKSPNLLKLENEETIQEKILKYLEIFWSANESLFYGSLL
ncbi:LOW QUALITY PROTEIN: immunity-related GTPase family M protein [Ctenodactylus gundi]